MNNSDEIELLSFLRNTAEIQIFESFAPTIKELWVNEFNPSFVGHHTYGIWNKNFEWNPEYKKVGQQAYDKNHIDWSYISNELSGPLLKFSRSNLLSDRPGRLYWARNFAAPDGLKYDEKLFSKWVDTVWRWVRKNGTKIPELPLQPYVLSGALSQIKD